MSESNSAAALTPEQAAAPTPTADSIECRMAERFDVDGEAQVAASDGSAVFRGHIVNLSLTGCFIGTIAYIKLAPGTPVDLTFHLNGFEGPKQFQIHAEARFSKPRQGIGFRFLRMTPVLQQALDTIIAALEAAKK